MPRYSEQFKRDAVALYENNEDLSLHAASAELGVNRSSLYSWLKQYGVRCEFLVPVFWGLGTVVFRVVGTGPRGASARTVSLSCLGWWVRWLCACRSLRYGFGGRC